MIGVGDKVGAKRWPCYGAHPDCWGRPWSGVVLAPTDPRAWRGTLAFPCLDGRDPDPVAVAAHVARHPSLTAPGADVPVLWDFGEHGSRVWWERAASVRPYVEDLEAWFLARVEARPLFLNRGAA